MIDKSPAAGLFYMHSMKQHFSHLAVWVLAVATVTSALFGAYYMNEYQSLRQAVLDHEARVEGSLSQQSILNSPEHCRNNWFKRLERAVTMLDTCG